MASLHEPQSASQTSLSESPDAAPWRPKSVAIGTVLANRYRIVGELGLGSTGAVFQADDIQQGKSVAVRVLVPRLAQDAGLIARIRARIERNAAINRRDPAALINFVDITDIGMTLEAEVFVVTDYMDGDHVATMLSRGGRLPWSRARSLIIRLAQIVHGLHQEGIVVGALEARRCYAIRGKNKHETIKVLSTAIVEHLAATIGPHAGHAAAVLARYVAPEQACGEPIDPRSDVYSLGVIAYELLTGQLPFTDPNPVRLIAMHLQRPPIPPREAAPGAGIPLEVEAALLRALAKSPDDRFQSMDAFGSALLAIPESVTGTGAHAVVPASLAASEIPAMRVEAPGASPGVAAATLAVTNRTSPPAEPYGVSDPGVAEATLAVTNETSPPAEPLAELVARTEARAEAALHDPRTASSHPTAHETEAVPVARAAPISARIQTHVTLRPGTLSSDVITAPNAANMQQTPARPATLPPTLGSPLRLPPPPKLGAPTPAGSGVPTAVPRPPTLGMATLPRPSSGPFAAAASPAQVAAASSATAEASPTAEAPHTSEAAVETAAKTLVAETTTPVPSSATTPSDGSPAAPPTALETPVVAPPAVAAVLEAARTDEQRAASSTSSGRRPVIRLTEVRKPESDSASSSGTYVRSALTDSSDTAKPRSDAPAAAFAAAAAAAASAATSASKSDSRMRAAVSDEAVRSAALKPQLAPVPASLSQVTGTTESLVANVPKSRTGLWIGVGMVAAAGIAAIVMTSPSFTGTVPPTEPVAVRPPPTRVADADPPSTLPERSTGVVAPRPEPDTAPEPADSLGEPEPTADTSKDPGATGPVATLVPPTDTETKTEPDGKKKDPTKKKKRIREETPEEEPEKDVFDQLREHMAKKKAAEDAYKASLQKPTTPTPPATSPTPDTKASEPLSEADKAKETLERARQAASSGNPQLAYSLAKQSYGVTKSQEALELMGVSACRLKNAENARSAANALSGSRRDAVVAACSKTGTVL
jgi:hypothetical protein